MLGKNGSKSIKNQQNQDTKSELKHETASLTSSDYAIDYCSAFDEQNYLITNLVMCRELGFISGIAVPIAHDPDDEPMTATGRKLSKQSKPEKQPNQNSLLFSYNLRGRLMKCVHFGSNDYPKDKDTSLLLTTRDGEYLILAESSHLIKIMRTFDLTPLYALNTNELATAFQGEQNKVKSMALADSKYLLVGLENGKLIIYNVDFNRWHHEYSCRY